MQNMVIFYDLKPWSITTETGIHRKLYGMFPWKIFSGCLQKEEVKMSFEEAIRLVQIHERARQGRLRAKFMRVIRRQEEMEIRAQNHGAPTLDPDVAATRIQKVGS